MADTSVTGNWSMAVARGVEHFLRDEEGQSLIEYALIACLIGLGAVVALTSMRTAVSAVFNKLGNVLANAI